MSKLTEARTVFKKAFDSLEPHERLIAEEAIADLCRIMDLNMKTLELPDTAQSRIDIRTFADEMASISRKYHA